MNFNFNRSNPYVYNTSFKPSDKPKKKIFAVVTVLALIVVLATLYFYHPPFNWHSPAFVYYLMLIIGGGYILALLAFALGVIKGNGFKRASKVFATATVASVLVITLSSIATSRIFNAKEYANRLTVESSDFTFVPEVDFTKTPIIDRVSTLALGDRVMGQMPELVSQFEVSNDYTQISYRDSVYRVTPLEYADVFKYFTNRSEGIPAYILVNSTTGETELVRLKDLGLEGMRYVPSGLFNENLMRKLQITYPTKIFGSPSFEIDEDGRPWYICTTYTYKAMGTKKMVDGVVLFDPITGESTYYEDPLKAPKWVDRIYSESLIIEEFDDYGSLRGGFLNSMFGQKDVFVSSEGYNYLESGGDIWIYSGITSANSDAANLGFYLVNLRTHEARLITSAGANEVSAMSSAEGSVRNFGYKATFPLLVNVNNRPVYLMSLKDDAGLIKMYAMVDATNYQIVETVGIDEGLDTLKTRFLGGQIIVPDSELEHKTITITSLRFLNVGNGSVCYIVGEDGQKYRLTIDKNNVDLAGFINVGDRLEVTYHPSDINLIKDAKTLN